MARKRGEVQPVTGNRIPNDDPRCDWTRLGERWRAACNGSPLHNGPDPLDAQFRFCPFCGREIAP